ncbi:MAG: FAD-dependent oxidoreductase [Candidatus Eremiobacteraeota bacterium]|nr:FAD-dependent oxidoreductase [Candidatus Eremiobacteraeota bacterium]
MAPRRVAIVGGGLAGLAAAVDLKDRGWNVEVFERSRLLGGRATSFEIDGREVDNGQHVFLACCTAFIDFVERIGMSDYLHLQERFDVIALSKAGVRSRLRAAPLPAPLHLLASFMRYRHMKWPARLQVAYALTKIRSALASQESFQAWLTRNGQSSEAIAAFWDPFVVPALNASLERVTAADAAFVIVNAFLSDADAARFGWSTIPLEHVMRAAAERADAVHLSTTVFNMEAQAEHSVTLQTANGAHRFDAVVLAVAPPQLARLLGDPRRFGVSNLERFEAKPIVDIHLWHDGGATPFDFAALIDSPVQWIFQKGDGYLCCSVSAADRYMAMDTAELTALAWNEVRETVRELASASLLKSAVTRNPNATYLAQPGIARPRSRTLQTNVAIAGSWTGTGWPDTMESAVRSGREAAAVLDGAATGFSRSAKAHIEEVPAVG